MHNDFIKGRHFGRNSSISKQSRVAMGVVGKENTMSSNTSAIFFTKEHWLLMVLWKLSQKITSINLFRWKQLILWLKVEQRDNSKDWNKQRETPPSSLPRQLHCMLFGQALTTWSLQRGITGVLSSRKFFPSSMPLINQSRVLSWGLAGHLSICSYRLAETVLNSTYQVINHRYQVLMGKVFTSWWDAE